MHSEVYEPIWFKFGMMIDKSELYIWILPVVISTWIQSHKSARNEQFLRPLSPSCLSFYMELGLLLRPVGLMNLILLLSRLSSVLGRDSALDVCVPADPRFISQDHYSNERLLTKTKINTGLCSVSYETISFKIGMKIDVTKRLYFDSGINDLSLH